LLLALALPAPKPHIAKIDHGAMQQHQRCRISSVAQLNEMNAAAVDFDKTSRWRKCRRDSSCSDRGDSNKHANNYSETDYYGVAR
jgi:hypothetical protein